MFNNIPRLNNLPSSCSTITTLKGFKYFSNNGITSLINNSKCSLRFLYGIIITFSNQIQSFLINNKNL